MPAQTVARDAIFPIENVAAGDRSCRIRLCRSVQAGRIRGLHGGRQKEASGRAAKQHAHRRGSRSPKEPGSDNHPHRASVPTEQDGGNREEDLPAPGGTWLRLAREELNIAGPPGTPPSLPGRYRAAGFGRLGRRSPGLRGFGSRYDAVFFSHAGILYVNFGVALSRSRSCLPLADLKPFLSGTPVLSYIH